MQIHRVLDEAVEQIGNGLTVVRGLGIESRWIKGLAFACVAAGQIKGRLSPHRDTITVDSFVLKSIAFMLYKPRHPGWNRYGSLWAWVSDTKRINEASHVSLVGGEPALWAEVRQSFAERIPAAVLSESRDGMRVGPDRTNNVRNLTNAEHALADRIRGYVDANVPVSILLYGPQGSAKTTAACSIAHLVCGSYFRLSAGSVCDDLIRALVALQPRVVIVDDIDRVDDVGLLELLDALAVSNTVVFCTSNTSPDDRHGDAADDLMDAALVRSGRMDIHYRVAGLPPEAHAQIRREQGLTHVDLGPRAGDLLASDLATLGRRHAAGDLPDPIEAVADLLQRRTNTCKSLRAVPRLRLRPVAAEPVVAKE